MRKITNFPYSFIALLTLLALLSACGQTNQKTNTSAKKKVVKTETKKTQTETKEVVQKTDPNEETEPIEKIDPIEPKVVDPCGNTSFDLMANI